MFLIYRYNEFVSTGLSLFIFASFASSNHFLGIWNFRARMSNFTADFLHSVTVSVRIRLHARSRFESSRMNKATKRSQSHSILGSLFSSLFFSSSLAKYALSWEI